MNQKQRDDALVKKMPFKNILPDILLKECSCCHIKSSSICGIWVGCPETKINEYRHKKR